MPACCDGSGQQALCSGSKSKTELDISDVSMREVDEEL